MENTADRKAAAEARGWAFSMDPAMGTIHIAEHASDEELYLTDPELVALLDAVEDLEAEAADERCPCGEPECVEAMDAPSAEEIAACQREDFGPGSKYAEGR